MTCAERIAENRYKAGLVNYLNVVYAERHFSRTSNPMRRSAASS